MSSTKLPSAPTDYDYVVSEASVGRIAGVPFTVGGIDENQTVTLDIDKSRFVDVSEGSIVELSPAARVQVVRITSAPAPQKGKVYFKLLK